VAPSGEDGPLLTYYQSSTIHGAGGFHEWMVYDPADLARVAQSQAQEWEIQPKSWWSVQYPGLSYPLPSWSDLQNNSVMGVAFDPTTRRLYVSVRFASVYVYEVQSSSTDTTPPAPPTGLSIK